MGKILLVPFHGLILPGKVFSVESHAGGDGIREPIHHYVVQEFVKRKLFQQTTILATHVRGIRPGAEFLENVSRQSTRWISETVAFIKN